MNDCYPLFVELDRGGVRGRPSQQRVSLAVTPEGALAVVPPAPWGGRRPDALVLAPPPWPRVAPRPPPPEQRDFQIKLDVHHYAPEEISVKVSDRFLLVEASHGERRDEQGWVKRSLGRRYIIPDGCNADAVESRLSPDGVLTVTAPWEEPRSERVVPIVQTGPVRSPAEPKPEIGDGEAVESLPLPNEDACLPYV